MALNERLHVPTRSLGHSSRLAREGRPSSHTGPLRSPASYSLLCCSFRSEVCLMRRLWIVAVIAIALCVPAVGLAGRKGDVLGSAVSCAQVVGDGHLKLCAPTSWSGLGHPAPSGGVGILRVANVGLDSRDDDMA